MSATRAAVERVVMAHGAPIGVDAVAEAVGLHPNAVRRHLAALVAEGRLLQHTEHRATRGRPRLLWSAHPGVEPHRAVALLLAEMLATGEPATVVGRRHAEVPDADGIDAVVEVMAEHGFDPVRDGQDVVLRACPFSDVASRNPAAVCGLHLGLAAGVAEAAGLEVTGMTVHDPSDGGCRLHLR